MEALLGITLPGPYKHAMYMMADCYVACGYAAYAYFNSWLSVYKGKDDPDPAKRDKNIRSSPVHVHEFG